MPECATQQPGRPEIYSLFGMPIMKNWKYKSLVQETIFYSVFSFT